MHPDVARLSESGLFCVCPTRRVGLRRSTFPGCLGCCLRRTERARLPPNSARPSQSDSANLTSRNCGTNQAGLLFYQRKLRRVGTGLAAELSKPRRKSGPGR